jgi:hypothetical protein
MALRAPRQLQTPPPKLLRQRVAQLAIIIDNENPARIRHQFQPPPPARTVILPADTKSIKDIMIRDDIFPSLLVAPALVRLDDLSEISLIVFGNSFPFSFHKTFWSVGPSSKLCRLCSGPI